MGQPEGSWGRYQVTASVMMALLKAPAAWFQLSLLYLSPEIHFRCAHPLNQTLHSNYTRDYWDKACSYEDEEGAQQTCEEFEYYSEHFSHTANMKWDLVCSREHFVTIGQLALMFGVSAGNAMGGFLAGRVGRKPVLTVATMLMPVMSALIAFVPHYQLFLLFRFFTGLCLGNTISISFIMGAELVSDQWRPVISILHQVPFGIGQTLLALTAYFIRDWHNLQMFLSIYSLIFLPYYWLVEESPKWLMSVGRFKEAQRVQNRINHRNGRPVSDTERKPITEKFTAQIVKSENNNQCSSDVCFTDLFRTPLLRRYTLSIWVMWYCAGLSFFALNAFQPSLGSDPFINIGVGGLVGGIPGNILTIWLVKRFGRKRIIIIGHIFVAVFTILIPVYDVGESVQDWQRRLLGLCSLIAMSIAYPALFLLSAELLPSVLRAQAMLIANQMGRLGNTTAPLVGPTGVFSRWIPLAIIATAPLVSVLLMLSIPDTWNKPLPTTIQDVEAPARKEEDKNKRKAQNVIYKPVAVNES